MSKEKKLISVIVPFFNAEKSIINTIDSLNWQSYKNFEVIFVDDGSNDKTSEIIKGYDCQFKYDILRKNNSGVSDTRNVGMNIAEGKYIYFLDSDDCISKDLFLEIYNESKNMEADIFIFNYQSVNSFNEIIRIEHGNIKKIFFENIKPKVLVKKYLQKENKIHICSMVFNKRFLIKEKLQFNVNYHYGEDIEFFIKAILLAKSIKYSLAKYFYYINNPESQMKKFSEKRFTGLNAIKSLQKKSFINDNEIKQLLTNRYIEEILYICQSYILYCKGKEYKQRILKIISDSNKLFRKYKVFSDNDKSVYKEVKILGRGLLIFTIYFRTNVFIIKNLRKLRNYLKVLNHGKKFKE